ncbi:tricarballylate/proton symporter TcuC [Paraburkholderia terrae]
MKMEHEPAHAIKRGPGAVIQVTSGHFLEMFDFVLFGFYASSISRAFFPSYSEYAKLMLTFVILGAGFLMRPIGAIVLGSYVDRVGRRKGLLVTLGLMALGIVLIAFTPGYATIGWLAPLMVLIGRLAQGFAAGAELGNVAVYLTEMAPKGREGFYVSWQPVGQQLAIILAALLGYTINATLTPAQIDNWGWRVPFIVGCSSVPLLFTLRRSLVETEAFLGQRHRPTRNEIVQSVLANTPIILGGMLLVTGTSVSFYLLSIYTPTFGKDVLKLGATDTLLVSLCAAVCNAVMYPLFGALSDRIGRRSLLISASLLMAATSYVALHWLVTDPSFGRMLVVLLWMNFVYVAYSSGTYAGLSEVVPTEVRTTAWSLAFSLSAATFGGFTPAVATWLISVTGDKAAPALWMSAAGFFGLLATLYLYRQRTQRSGQMHRAQS